MMKKSNGDIMNTTNEKYFILFLLFFAINIFAKSDIDFNEVFNNKNACFLLYDLTANKMLTHYNNKQCAVRISPCSTFKVALALMAFDLGILKDENTVIKWDGITRDLSEWNKDQTPKTWLQYSTVWVSQWITPQLGALKIQNYLNDFQYGNRDISGGIDHFWLSSSLKISGNEQLKFLIRLWQNKLALSTAAINHTKKSLYSEKLENGATIYEKTGSGFVNGSNGKSDRIGWFVGYLFFNHHDYVFVTNFIDETDSKISSGLEAKDITKKILKQGVIS